MRHGFPIARRIALASFLALVPAMDVHTDGGLDARSSAAPSDFGFRVPQPEPPLPAGFDLFQPPRLDTTEAPAVAEASRTAGPGDTFVVSGGPFTKTLQFLVFTQTAAADAAVAKVEPIATTGIAAAALLPDNGQRWSMALVWPSGPDGHGRPVALNRTELWWAGPRQVVPGQPAAAYGRNLSHLNGTSRSWIYLKPQGKAGVWAPVTDVNPYRVEFRVPAGLAPGEYEVWAHNGHGGRFGWDGPVPLSVGPSPWAGLDRRTFDVRDYGARGDGRTDDGAAIAAALADAGRSAPATVYLPRGTYLVSRGLALPNEVRLLGDGRDATTIKAARGLGSDPTDSLLSADGASDGNGVEVSDLTLAGSPDLRVAVTIRSARNVRFTDARIRSAPGEYFDFSGVRGLFLENVELIGKGGFLGDASQVFIDRCDIRLSNDAGFAFATWGGREIAITRCRARDLEPSDPELSSAGRFLVSQPHRGSIRHVYIAGNETTALAPPPPAFADNNAGEQLLFEQCCTSYSGAVAHAAPTKLTLADGEPLPPDLVEEHHAVVFAGRGVGQHRRVVAFDPATRTATVSPPWRVVPDKESLVAIVGSASRIVVYQNALDGKPIYGAYDTASSGVHLFGNCFDVVVADNVFTRMRAGVEIWAVGVDGKTELNPSFFNLIANNVVRDSDDALFTHTMYIHGGIPGSVGLLGNIFRGNTGDGLARAGLHIETWQGLETGAHVMNVLEDNRFSGAPDGVLDVPSIMFADSPPGKPRTPVVATILRNNTFIREPAPFEWSRAFVTRPESSWIGAGNEWSGFELAPPPDGLAETISRRAAD